MPISSLETAMKQAAAEGRRWLGATAPNPAVGAAAVDANGNVLAVTAHRRAGTAHAETILIDQCREKGLLSSVAALCVTLEPCNHYGHTPPCSEAIIQSGIRKLAFGTRDPNPNVKGGGLDKLASAGIDIIPGIAEDECRQLIHAFAYKVTTGKPWITVKRAFDRDESMIPPPGQKTFTSAESLLIAPRLCNKADAIVTGSGTILADKPLFTVRYVQDHEGKRRWLGIVDRRGRVNQDYIEAAKERGLDAVVYNDFKQAFRDLSDKGAQDILVEAGPHLSQSVLDSGLWTMSVTVRQDETDQVNVEFSLRETMPFDTGHFRWAYILPEN